MSERGAEAMWTAAVALAALAVAIVSARPFAESWNDGSRLATIESLVDRHTFVIEAAIFARPPATDAERAAVRMVTLDKVQVDGRFYSDKPPVPALLLAGLYQLWRWSGGASAQAAPDRFVWWMTLYSSGLAYLVAVVALFRAGRTLRLPRRDRLLLVGSFALATGALPYARAVNGHELLLAVAMAIFALLAGGDAGGWSPRRLLAIGTLAGLGYTIDLAAGPLLLACVGVCVAVRTRRARPLGLVAGTASPWLLLHHAITFAIAGTLRPINAVPEYLAWAGSPFVGAMTGEVHHAGAFDFASYAVQLLIGSRGFLGHNPTLYVAIAGAVALWRQPPREAALLVCGAVWSVTTWLTYAALSNNYAGSCVSIRWFVPLLAPAYLLLAVVLRDHPSWRALIAATSALGALLALAAWWRGPWTKVPGWQYWLTQAGVVALVWRWATRLRRWPDLPQTMVP